MSFDGLSHEKGKACQYTSSFINLGLKDHAEESQVLGLIAIQDRATIFAKSFLELFLLRWYWSHCKIGMMTTLPPRGFGGAIVGALQPISIGFGVAWLNLLAPSSFAGFFNPAIAARIIVEKVAWSKHGKVFNEEWWQFSKPACSTSIWAESDLPLAWSFFSKILALISPLPGSLSQMKVAHRALNQIFAEAFSPQGCPLGKFVVCAVSEMETHPFLLIFWLDILPPPPSKPSIRSQRKMSSISIKLGCSTIVIVLLKKVVA